MKTFLVVRRRRIISLEKHERFWMRRGLNWDKVREIVIEEGSVQFHGEDSAGNVLKLLKTTTLEGHLKIPEPVRNEIARCLAANTRTPQMEEIEEA